MTEPDRDLLGRDAGEALDGLLALLRALIPRPGVQAGPVRAPAVVVELAGALQARAVQARMSYPMSDNSAGTAAAATLDRAEDHGWLSTGEAARRAGCTERHARRLAHGGHVTARRAGPRRWLIDLPDLQRHLRQEHAT